MANTSACRQGLFTRWRVAHLSLSEANTTVLLEHLAEEDLDVAFIRPGRSDPEEVQVDHLDEEAMMIVLPSSHTLARAGALPLSSLSRSRLSSSPVTPDPACSTK